MKGEQALFNLEIKKKSGSSINPDIHHSKVPSSGLNYRLRIQGFQRKSKVLRHSFSRIHRNVCAHCAHSSSKQRGFARKKTKHTNFVKIAQQPCFVATFSYFHTNFASKPYLQLYIHFALDFVKLYSITYFFVIIEIFKF